VGERRWQRFCEKTEAIEKRRLGLDEQWIRPSTPAGERVDQILDRPMSHEYNLLELLKRPGVHISSLLAATGQSWTDDEVNEQVEIDIKYAGYISRQEQEIERVQQQQQMQIPKGLDYGKIRGLSNEVRQKLMAVEPQTIGQAGRIAGVTHAAISLLCIHIKKSDVRKQTAKRV
jgi:tRNA uridine 5-carboxymethylaminomethyl modification enzyme